MRARVRESIILSRSKVKDLNMAGVNYGSVFLALVSALTAPSITTADWLIANITTEVCVTVDLFWQCDAA